jgi:maltose/moltooligosaccharide transporter
MMANWFDISNVAAPGLLPDTVKFSFYAGGVIFLLAVLWTIYSTKEYSPEQLEAFQNAEEQPLSEEIFTPRTAKKYFTGAAAWLLLGLISFVIIALNVEQLDKSLFILAGGFCFFAICQLVAGLMAKNNSNNGFAQVMSDLFSMPQTMRQLAFVQFFSWFPFFAMWTYTTAAVTEFHFGSSDVTSAAFNEGADWVGVLFSAYNLTSVFAAICIPMVVKYLNLRIAHMINLFLGGAGFISFLFINDPTLLIVSMIGIGFAWASILSVPYAILANALPAKKMGLYMGIFNFFIVLPQILAASILGFLITKVFDNQPVYALVVGGASMLLAGLLTLRVKEPEY